MIAVRLALLLAAATPSLAPLPLSELPPQVMAPHSCALFLWDRASRKRVLMALAAPARVRVAQDAAILDLPQARSEGDQVLGFAPRASFGDARLTVAVDLAITANDGAVGGAVVREGTITVTTPDGVAVVAPVAGLVGCR